MTWHFYILQCDHPVNSSNHLSPRKPITILLTIFFHLFHLSLHPLPSGNHFFCHCFYESVFVLENLCHRARKLGGRIHRQAVLEGGRPPNSVNSPRLFKHSCLESRTEICCGMEVGWWCHESWASRLDLGETKLFLGSWVAVRYQHYKLYIYFLISKIILSHFLWLNSVITSGIEVMGILEGWTISPKYSPKMW